VTKPFHSQEKLEFVKENVLLIPGPVTSFRLFRRKRNLRAISEPEYHRATTLLEADGFGRTVEFRIPRARQPCKVFVKSTPPTWPANTTLSQEQFESALNKEIYNDITEPMRIYLRENGLLA